MDTSNTAILAIFFDAKSGTRPPLKKRRPRRSTADDFNRRTGLKALGVQPPKLEPASFNLLTVRHSPTSDDIGHFRRHRGAIVSVRGVREADGLPRFRTGSGPYTLAVAVRTGADPAGISVAFVGSALPANRLSVRDRRSLIYQIQKTLCAPQYCYCTGNDAVIAALARYEFKRGWRNA